MTLPGAPPDIDWQNPEAVQAWAKDSFAMSRKEYNAVVAEELARQEEKRRSPRRASDVWIIGKREVPLPMVACLEELQAWYNDPEVTRQARPGSGDTTPSLHFMLARLASKWVDWLEPKILKLNLADGQMDRRPSILQDAVAYAVERLEQIAGYVLPGEKDGSVYLQGKKRGCLVLEDMVQSAMSRGEPGIRVTWLLGWVAKQAVLQAYRPWGTINRQEVWTYGHEALEGAIDGAEPQLIAADVAARMSAESVAIRLWRIALQKDADEEEVRGSDRHHEARDMLLLARTLEYAEGSLDRVYSNESMGRDKHSREEVLAAALGWSAHRLLNTRLRLKQSWALHMGRTEEEVASLLGKVADAKGHRKLSRGQRLQARIKRAQEKALAQ